MNTRYIPDNSKEIINEEANAVVYTSERNGKLLAIAYSGKSKRKDFFYNFATKERREEYINNYFNNLIDRKKAQLKHKEDLKSRKKDLAGKVKIGSIFYYSWGYEQTQCDFFQVVEKKGLKITLKEIGCETIEVISDMSENIKPVKDAFLKNAKTLVKMITPYGIKMSCGNASLIEDNERVFYHSWYY